LLKGLGKSRTIGNGSSRAGGQKQTTLDRGGERKREEGGAGGVYIPPLKNTLASRLLGEEV